MKKRLGITLDIFTGLSASAGLVVVFYYIVSRLPYRPAEQITEIHPADPLKYILLFVIASAGIFAALGLSGRTPAKIGHKAVLLAGVVVFTFVTAKAAGYILKNIYGKYSAGLQTLARSVVSPSSTHTFQETENPLGFEYMLLSQGTGMNSDDLRTLVAEEHIARLLEFRTYDSGNITVKAVKGNMVFRLSIPAGQVIIDSPIVSGLGPVLTVEKKNRGNMTVIATIR